MKKENYQKIFLIIFQIIIVFNFSFLNGKKIKVLLEKYSIIENNFEIEINGKDFLISDFYDSSYSSLLNYENLKISFNNEFFFINGKKLKIKNLKIKSKDSINFNKNLYPNDLLILNDENFIYLINELEVEDYVKYVLANETIPLWSIENHKVSAITIRTYAYYKINEAKKNNRIYDVKSSMYDQVYLGIKNYKNISIAVLETKDKIITWNDRPILAMYHICCGGIVPSRCIGFDFKNFPYLKREYACKNCKSYKDYEWRINLNLNDVCDKLSKKYKKNIKKIIKINNSSYTKSGAVKNINLKISFIDLKNNKKFENLILNNNEIRKLFMINKHNNSACFKIKLDRFNLVIEGKGRGHHMGLCQQGAKILLNNGKNYEEIIYFYYPNTEIKKIN